MKAKLLIVGIIAVIATSAAYVSFAYNQETKTAAGITGNDERPEPDTVSDPLCFEIDVSVKSSIYNEPIEVCYPLSDFGALGCTKPMMGHIHKHTNLFEREFDEFFMQELPGLPDGISKPGYEKCLDSVLEKRRLMAKHMEFESFSLVAGNKS